MTRQLTAAEREAFLAGVHIGVISVAALEPGRGPLAVPIWYTYDVSEGVSVITGRTSRKGRAIERAGRFALVAQQESRPYRYVAVDGPLVEARSVADGEVELIARRYFGTQLRVRTRRGSARIPPCTKTRWPPSVGSPTPKPTEHTRPARHADRRR